RLLPRRRKRRDEDPKRPSSGFVIASRSTARRTRGRRWMGELIKVSSDQARVTLSVLDKLAHNVFKDLNAWSNSTRLRHLRLQAMSYLTSSEGKGRTAAGMMLP